MRISASLRLAVQLRARGRCEYCRLPAECSQLPFSVDHVLPRKHGGSDLLENLAYACQWCNLHKGANLTGIDPATRSVRALFNPRTQSWHRNFEVSGTAIRGRSSIGRTTVRVLTMNDGGIRSLRKLCMENDLWPEQQSLKSEDTK